MNKSIERSITSTYVKVLADLSVENLDRAIDTPVLMESTGISLIGWSGAIRGAAEIIRGLDLETDYSYESMILVSETIFEWGLKLINQAKKR